MLLLVALAVGCQSSNSVVEPGAVLLHVKCASTAPRPDELRVWVWDSSVGIWTNVRVPSSGSLPTGNNDDFGTILIQPNAIQGSLGVHVRGLAHSVRVVDGVVHIQSLVEGSRVFDILLDTPAIDDCPFVPGPDQATCPGTDRLDADLSALDSASGHDGPPRDSLARADTEAATGGQMASAGGSGSPGAGGISGRGGSNPGQGGGGVTGSGGTRSAAGGDTTATGSTARGGAPAAGGATGSGGSTTPATSPPAVTLPGGACTTESSGAPCRNSDPTCYKYCGPERQGTKSTTCRGSKYIESDCTFSSTTNYACYAVTSAAACAATPPTSGTACSTADCHPCGSSTQTGYYDGANAAKTGYCVCSGGLWSCASVSAWPCPGRKGC